MKYPDKLPKGTKISGNGLHSFAVKGTSGDVSVEVEESQRSVRKRSWGFWATNGVWYEIPWGAFEDEIIQIITEKEEQI